MTTARSSVLAPLARWLCGVIDLVFPPTCALCGRLAAGEGLGERSLRSSLCGECEEAVVDGARRFCDRCAMPTTTLETESCPDCRAKRPPFAQARVLGLYDGQLRKVVLRMKHADHESLAAAIGVLLARRVQAAPFAEPPDVVIPAPMHWLKRAWRGTSAAEVLAAGLAHALGTPLATDALVCRRLIRKQAGLAQGERRLNVRGAYAVAWNYRLQGAAVLLVDDVVTTGATAAEAARVLLAAGARRVSVAAAARGTGLA